MPAWAHQDRLRFSHRLLVWICMVAAKTRAKFRGAFKAWLKKSKQSGGRLLTLVKKPVMSFRIVVEPRKSVATFLASSHTKLLLSIIYLLFFSWWIKPRKNWWSHRESNPGYRRERPQAPPSPHWFRACFQVITRIRCKTSMTFCTQFCTHRNEPLLKIWWPNSIKIGLGQQLA